MSKSPTSFEALRTQLQNAIEAWPNLLSASYLEATRTFDDFNNAVSLAALQPIEDRDQLCILQEGAEHLLKHEGAGMPEDLEDAMAAVVAQAIEQAESPLHAALLALVSHRAMRARPSI